ncbi:MAG: adenylosuccinate synthase [Planctomycetota bacterium]
MSVKCVVGLQWGDEGKGKIVDILSRQADFVVRFQGGHNAGHTVVLGRNKFVLHLIPSGILHPGVICVIANGVVIDPEQFLKELEQLRQQGIQIRNNIYISDRAHLILPYHKVVDDISENNLGQNKIGTTGRGIGPCYTDKYARIGIRVIDLFNQSYLKERIKANLAQKNILISSAGLKPLSWQKIYDEYLDYARKLKPYVIDARAMLMDALKNNKRMLFEGAQGTLLDVDFGTYPFVTSSNADISGLSAGIGITIKKFNGIIGILKAYTTRVGGGPFPTELTGALGETLRQRGGEFGATTGRPRRCGWLDLVSAKYATEINSVDSIAITKLDVLSHLKTIKVVVAYRNKGRIIRHFPSDVNILYNCGIIYKEMKGWQKDISVFKTYRDLPDTAKKYLDFIQKSLDTPIDIISIGADRRQTIFK